MKRDESRIDIASVPPEGRAVGAVWVSQRGSAYRTEHINETHCDVTVLARHDEPLRIDVATRDEVLAACERYLNTDRADQPRVRGLHARLTGTSGRDHALTPPAEPAGEEIDESVEVSPQPKIVVWFSRHDMLKSQIAELRRLFGLDVRILHDPEPFGNADDVIARFRRSGATEMVIVAPLSVVQKITEAGLHPLWAEMEVVPPERAEVVAQGRGYRFVRFRRIAGVRLEFEELS